MQEAWEFVVVYFTAPVSVWRTVPIQYDGWILHYIFMSAIVAVPTWGPVLLVGRQIYRLIVKRRRTARSKARCQHCGTMQSKRLAMLPLGTCDNDQLCCGNCHGVEHPHADSEPLSAQGNQ